MESTRKCVICFGWGKKLREEEDLHIKQAGALIFSRSSVTFLVRNAIYITLNSKANITRTRNLKLANMNTNRERR
jgi:hypothetical protein